MPATQWCLNSEVTLKVSLRLGLWTRLIMTWGRTTEWW